MTYSLAPTDTPRVRAKWPTVLGLALAYLTVAALIDDVAVAWTDDLAPLWLNHSFGFSHKWRHGFHKVVAL